MKSILLALAIAIVPCRLAMAEPLAEPWYSEYSGQQLTGKHVIGCWQFNAKADNEDSSGHGLRLELQGAKIDGQGKFGGCLESFRGHPTEDVRHRAMVKNDPRLTPGGAFTLEMWIKPKAELKGYPDAFLLDKKYAGQDDYQLVLGPETASGARSLRACLGFGTESATWNATPVEFETGKWYHVAFTYDGQGTGSFFVNGVPQGGKTLTGYGKVSRGKNGLTIGDRFGSYYHGFPGYIDQVRISDGVLEFRQVKMERVSDRSCFVRMEKGASLRLAITNLRPAPLADVQVTVSANGMPDYTTKVASLAAGGNTVVECPLDASLRPGVYRVSARLTVPGPMALETSDAFDIRIVARRPPLQFPVLMWGVYRGVTDELPRLKQIGFTHALGLGADYPAIWNAGKPTAAADPDGVAKNKRMLDEALANDFSVVASLAPGSWLRGNEKFWRIDRDGGTKKVKQVAGKKKNPDICGLFPEAQQFCRNVGVSVGQTYGEYPAFVGSLIHSELRDGAYPCFHPHDIEACRKATGADIPAEIKNKSGVKYQDLANFPANRVIPDQHPIYAYYRWYWKQGDGWNTLNTAVHEGLKAASGNRLWTFHDPAVRVARVYGSGGEVDYISQWTYSYPDPIRIGLATDELLATAAGRAKQQVMKMTQIIWYRGQTAPIPKSAAEALPFQADWERQQPDAPFITISPAHLREAFWTKIARPIRGIMYHGWQSLVQCDSTGGYRFTNAQTQHELARLTSQVVRPLGPTLLSVPGLKSDVAFLQSFASEMFAGRGTYGWGRGWAGDAYHVMLYAHLQPEIVFDETVVERGLEGFRVLVMCDCDVITQEMLKRIQEFQAKGGVIVGDERLTPAIKPDILLPVYTRTGRNDDDKAALLGIAAQLRSKLDARYPHYADSSNPEVIPYRRRHRDTDYVFLANDHREYGQYVGQHGIVMENGLPAKAVVSVQRPAGFVYDLVENHVVPSRQEQGKLVADVQLGPCDGRLYMVTSRAIEGVRVQGPAKVKRGERVSYTIEVTDGGGRPVDAVVPLEVAIRDAEGATAEYSGFYAAIDGRVTIELAIAANDMPGAWQIEARELASGRRTARFFTVASPPGWPPAKKPLSKELANPVQPKG
jgi:hypothetical protein